MISITETNTVNFVYVGIHVENFIPTIYLRYDVLKYV